MTGKYFLDLTGKYSRLMYPPEENPNKQNNDAIIINGFINLPGLPNGNYRDVRVIRTYKDGNQEIGVFSLGKDNTGKDRIIERILPPQERRFAYPARVTTDMRFPSVYSRGVSLDDLVPCEIITLVEPGKISLSPEKQPVWGIRGIRDYPGVSFNNFQSGQVAFGIMDQNNFDILQLNLPKTESADASSKLRPERTSVNVIQLSPSDKSNGCAKFKSAQADCALARFIGLDISETGD